MGGGGGTQECTTYMGGGGTQECTKWGGGGGGGGYTGVYYVHGGGTEECTTYVHEGYTHKIYWTGIGYVVFNG